MQPGTHAHHQILGRRATRRRTLSIAAAVIVVASGWYLFRPELLILRRQVHEPFPATVADQTPLSPVALRSCIVALSLSWQSCNVPATSLRGVTGAAQKRGEQFGPVTLVGVPALTTASATRARSQPQKIQNQ
jgi:hypothetical protein